MLALAVRLKTQADPKTRPSPRPPYSLTEMLRPAAYYSCSESLSLSEARKTPPGRIRPN